MPCSWPGLQYPQCPAQPQLPCSEPRGQLMEGGAGAGAGQAPVISVHTVAGGRLVRSPSRDSVTTQVTSVTA